MMFAFFRCLLTPFVGNRFGPSLGRLVFIVLFVFCLWQWAHGKQTPEHAFQYLIVITGYVFASKVVTQIGAIKMKSVKNDPPRP